MIIEKQRYPIMIALALSVLFVMTTTQGIAAELTLRVHHFLGEESLPHQMLIEPWAERIESASNGRIEVEIYPAMTLGGRAPALVEQVREGVVDIIWTAAAYTPGRFPRTEVFTLPMVHRGDPVATNLAIMETLDQGLIDDFEGLHPLLIHVHSGHALHMSKEPVTRMEDFTGLTLRPPGRGVGSWTIQALGADTTKKRHPKLPRALEKGALDGALMSFQLAQTMGVVEAVKSHTLLDEEEYFGTSIYLFLMNKARYDALPEELRAVIDRNSGQRLAREIGGIWREAGNAALVAARKRGNRIDVLSGEALHSAHQALQGVLSRWMKEVDKQQINGPRLIRTAREAVEHNTRAN
ncbi:MAG: TRAP transporter substrate-binding protein [Sedimenticola sp.]